MYVNMLSAMAIGYVIETFKYSLGVRLVGRAKREIERIRAERICH